LMSWSLDLPSRSTFWPGLETAGTLRSRQGGGSG
jgi:hypothetical protein